MPIQVIKSKKKKENYYQEVKIVVTCELHKQALNVIFNFLVVTLNKEEKHEINILYILLTQYIQNIIIVICNQF